MDRFHKISDIICIVAICILTFTVFSAILCHFANVEITVISKVTDVIFFDKHMFVIFDNGESYNIDYPSTGYRLSGELDFTVNSKMRIKLALYDTWWWQTDNIWEVVSMVKVPSKVGE